MSAVPQAAGPGDDPMAEPLKKLLGASAKPLADKLGTQTVGDLLRYYPFRVEEPGRLSDLSDLPMGELVTVVASVASVSSRRMRDRPGWVIDVVIGAPPHQLKLVFFTRGAKPFPPVKVGETAIFTGTVARYREDRQLKSPRVEKLDDGTGRLERLDMPRPVYRLAGSIRSSAIQAAVATVLDVLPDPADPVPAPVRERHHLMGVREALEQIHRPVSEAAWWRARWRLTFEEAFVLQAALARRRAARGEEPAVVRAGRSDGLLAAFDARLPFTLTDGQQVVAAEIAQDLARPHPMLRLLQGEVGSGKTVVALRAMLTVVDSGGQAALLAPTEVLATQHHRSITGMLGDLAAAGMLGGAEQSTRVALLTGSMPAAARRAALLEIASGQAGIVVGTHALLQSRVGFADLGLVVVDEQHRFGVEQRDALRDKGRSAPHTLVMTATPIPRTVAMTVFGDLATSTLAELPAGRAGISSHVVPAATRPAWLQRTWRRVAEEVGRGRQVYVVCPRIGGEGQDEEDLELLEPADGDEPGGAAPAPGRPGHAVLELVEQLRAEPALAGLRIEVLHGRMPAEEREQVMAGFTAGRVDVLVATTVIEVGVDVPNATAMVVMDADRFGVSQLHQLRGRVGRGREPGVCLLVSHAEEGSAGLERLARVAATTDGFELAELDVELRKEGDVLGARQHGSASRLRLLRVTRDRDLIERAREQAWAVVEQDPTLEHHPALSAAIAAMLAGDAEDYLERG